MSGTVIVVHHWQVCCRRFTAGKQAGTKRCLLADGITIERGEELWKST